MSDDTKPNEQGAAQQPAAQSAAASASGAESEVGTAQLKDMIAALQTDLAAKNAAVAEKHDQYVRAVAETENVRRRLEKEKDETAKYAITKFAKDILSVGDNFQRAISAVPKEAIDTDPALKTLLEGVVLAEREYRVALERHGVKVISPAGHPFNPHHHQAVMEQENPDVPNGTVLQVFQLGYLIDDRCLRPAMVVVSRGGAKTAQTPNNMAPNNPPPSNAGPEEPNND
ncbi:MAG TPA: nucleotide exchange factor GrpE [Hyphomicrobium sp.]|nr:nucleotide exchange factor GrpE [Hyphomicrobium sp.]